MAVEFTFYFNFIEKCNLVGLWPILQGLRTTNIFLAEFRTRDAYHRGATWSVRQIQRCCCNVSVFTEIILIILREDEDRANEFSKLERYCSLHIACSDINSDFSHTLYLCVLCGSENKQRLFPYTALTESECVYCAVRAEFIGVCYMKCMLDCCTVSSLYVASTR